MLGLSLPQLIAVAILPIIFALTVHEAAHAWAARRLGDPTAARLGRLTLNPVKHIDPVGTLLLPGLLLALGSGILFGWAKPVPVTWSNLRQPKRDMALVSAAGPLSNLAMALIWILLARLSLEISGEYAWAAKPLGYMGQFGAVFNVMLFVLNLLPLPPLDGGRVAMGLLPRRASWQLSRLEPYGAYILLALIFIPIGTSSALGLLIGPPIRWTQGALVSLAGL